MAADGEAMAALGESGAGRSGNALERHEARMGGARIKRTRLVLGMESRAVDRLLQIHAVIDMVQQHQRRPLVLLVAAGVPKAR